MLRRRSVWLVIIGCVAIGQAAGEDKPERPRVVMSSPLAVSPGEAAVVQLRGFKLDQATRVQIEGQSGLGDLAIKKKEKSGLPPQVDAKEAGDTIVEMELKLPENFSQPRVKLIVEGPDGATEPYELLVLAVDKLTAEVEPNERLAKAQPVELGRKIRGMISQQRDVDAFRFSGKAGQKVLAEVLASRCGSTLDGVLSLYDDRGRILASVDDGPEGRDPVLCVTLPRDGDYLLVLIDAQDRGGPTHPYLLEIKPE